MRNGVELDRPLFVSSELDRYWLLSRTSTFRESEGAETWFNFQSNNGEERVFAETYPATLRSSPYSSGLTMDGQFISLLAGYLLSFDALTGELI